MVDTRHGDAITCTCGARRAASAATLPRRAPAVSWPAGYAASARKPQARNMATWRHSPPAGAPQVQVMASPWRVSTTASSAAPAPCWRRNTPCRPVMRKLTRGGSTAGGSGGASGRAPVPESMFCASSVTSAAKPRPSAAYNRTYVPIAIVALLFYCVNWWKSGKRLESEFWGDSKRPGRGDPGRRAPPIGRAHVWGGVARLGFLRSGYAGISARSGDPAGRAAPRGGRGGEMGFGARGVRPAPLALPRMTRFSGSIPAARAGAQDQRARRLRRRNAAPSSSAWNRRATPR